MRAFYSVNFNARQCRMRISVNGIPLLGLDVEGQCSSRYPFNDLLLESGMATIKYEMLPLPGEVQLQKRAYLSCVVELFDKESHSPRPIATMAAYETPRDQETILPLMVHETAFQVSVPYAVPGWKQSKKLDMPKDELRTLVLNKYNFLIAMLRNRSFAPFEQAFKEREDRMGVCFYLSEEEKRARMEDVRNDVQNSTSIPAITPLDILEFAADKRLVRLVKADGESSLRLLNEEAGEETYLELWLHMKQGSNDLTII